MIGIQYLKILLLFCSTKYLGGHSDLCAGVVTVRTQELWTELNIYRTTMGAVLVSVMPCIQAVLRSLVGKNWRFYKSNTRQSHYCCTIFHDFFPLVC